MNSSRVRSGYLRSQTQSGFTLIELMIAISILALLMTIAVPNFNDAALGGRLSSYANNFVASAHLARSEAIKRNANISICALSADGASCGAGGWQQGWCVFNPVDNPNCVTNDSTKPVIQAQAALPSGYSMKDSGGLVSLSFQPTGLVTTASLTVCRKTPSVGRMERVVKVKTGGRTSVARTTAGVCL